MDALTDFSGLQKRQRTNKLLHETSREDIFVGDIMLLKRNDIAPCDMLLLATSEKLQGVQVCRIDPMFVNGVSGKLVREAISLTKSFNDWTADATTMPRFLKRLSARVSYQEVDGKLQGKFKLKSDPRVERFEEAHVVRTGFIVLSEYCVGMVIFNGRTRTIVDNRERFFRKTSGIEVKVRAFSLMLSILCIFAAVLTHLIAERLATADSLPIDETFGFVRLLVLYISIFPVGVNLLATLFYLIAVVSLELSVRRLKVESSRKQVNSRLATEVPSLKLPFAQSEEQIGRIERRSLQVLNPIVIPDLGDVDDAFFDKTGTLTGVEQQVKSVALRSKVYICSHAKSFEPLAVRVDVNPAQRAKFEDRLQTREDTKSKMGEVNQEHSNIPRMDTYLLPKKTNPFKTHSYTSDLPEEVTVKKVKSRKNSIIGKLNKSNSRGDMAPNLSHLPADLLENLADENEFASDCRYSIQLKHLLMMLSVCHNASPSRDTFMSDNLDDILCLNLARDFGFVYESYASEHEGFDEPSISTPLCIYYVREPKKAAQAVDVYFMNEFDPSRNSSPRKRPLQRPLARQTLPGCHTVRARLRREHAAALEPRTFANQYSNLVANNAKLGLRSTVFGSKNLSLDQAMQLHSRYLTACKNKIDVDYQLDELARSMECDLSFEAVLGVEATMKTDARRSLENLKHMGVNVHMLSGDSRDACLNAGRSLGLMGDEDNCLHLDFMDLENGRSRLKNILEQVTSRIEKVTNILGSQAEAADGEGGSARRADGLMRTSTIKMGNFLSAKKFVMAVSGEAMSVIETSPYLYQHVKFVFEFCRTVVGYNFGGQQKALLVRMFQELDHTTLAVGDGLNDLPMLARADVGIQLASPKFQQSFGDIVVNDLEAIDWAMSNHCRQWNESLHLVVNAIFKLSLSFFVITALYQFFCEGSAATVFASAFICGACVFSVLAGLAFTFLTERYPNGLRDKLKGLFCEKDYLTKQVHIKEFLRDVLPQAAIDGVVAMLLPIIAINGQRLADGSSLVDNNMLIIIVASLTVLSYNFKLWCSAEHGRLVLFVATLGATLFVAGILYGFSVVSFMNHVYSLALAAASESANIWLLVLTLACFLLLVAYMMHVSLVLPKCFPVNCALEKAMGRGDSSANIICQNRNWRMFLARFCPTDTFANTFRKCFDHTSEVDLSILRLLLGADDDHRASRYRRISLAFYSSIMTDKFMIYMVNRFGELYSYLLVIASATFLGILLLDTLFSADLSPNRYWEYAFIWLISTGLYFACFGMKFSRRVSTYGVVYLASFFVASFAYTFAVRADFTLIGSCGIIFVCLHYGLDFGDIILFALFAVVGLAITLVTNTEVLQRELWNTLDDQVLTFGVISFACLFASTVLLAVATRRINEKLLKDEFVSGAKVDSNSLKAKELLSLLLPRFVLDQISNFSNMEATNIVLECEEPVTVLFCDIADFEEVVKNNENNVVHVLDRIFRKFDDLCLLHGVQKIETVSKTYMAAAGLSVVDSALPTFLSKINQTVRVLNLAKSMMDVIREYESLKLKIGIHVGIPVMGVIGFHKPQFSLIGDVVNTTSRFCTTGKKAHIMLSQEAWQRLEDCNPLADGYAMKLIPTKMKGKGDQVPVYHLFRQTNNLLKRIQRIADSEKQLHSAEAENKRRTLRVLVNVIKQRRRLDQVFEKFEQIIHELIPSFVTLKKLKTNFIDVLLAKTTTGQQTARGETTHEDGSPLFVSPSRSRGGPRPQGRARTFEITVRGSIEADTPVQEDEEQDQETSLEVD